MFSFKSDAGQLVPQVKPELALALYGVRRQLPDSPLLRRCFHAIVSMFQAAHNCDYYITKYQGKSMEQLQNLFAQIACGLRRLQLEEESATEPSNSKTLARKTLLRIAMAANRSSWCSCCELAIYIKTGALCRKTHWPVQMFPSRPSFLLHQCGRLLHRSHEQPIEAPDGTGDQMMPLEMLFFQKSLHSAAQPAGAEAAEEADSAVQPAGAEAAEEAEEVLDAQEEGRKLREAVLHPKSSSLMPMPRGRRTRKPQTQKTKGHGAHTLSAKLPAFTTIGCIVAPTSTTWICTTTSASFGEKNGRRARREELLSAEKLMYSFSTTITFWHAAIGKLWAIILARGSFR